MTSSAFFLILCSVLLHATWHFISKSQRAGLGFFLVFSLSLCLTMLPFLLLAGVKISGFPLHLWGCILTGGLFGMLGDVGLSYAYRNAEISLAYPMSRALPVLFTVIVTAAFGLGSRLTPVVITGMLVIFAGCVLMPLPSWKRIRLSDYMNKGMFGILLAAVAATGYTIVDSYGIHAIMSYAPDSGRIARAGTYSCLRELVVFSSLTLLAVARNGKRPFPAIALLRQPHPYLAGIFAGLAYVLVLTAMGLVSNVCYVQAFRQLSLPIGLLLGVLILKEKVTGRKIAAMCLILGGLLAVTLG